MLTLTLLGLALTLAGTGCACVALWRDHTQYGDGPLWPLLARAWQWLRVQSFRLMPWRRRNATLQAQSIGVSVSVGTAWATFVGPEIPEDAPLEKQVMLLVQRVNNIEKAARDDRGRHNQDVKAVHDEINKLGERLDQADRDVERLAKDAVVGTARLQLSGLLLVGMGTVLMAIPAVLSLL
ncbi:hypothetical protein GA0070624_1000 [Micromonospora rhizosphaerae]|uniref:Lipoprotein n=1 Tax=Micromonospora rhizosphaerae TaxID=568872 RepID=A0A1C6RHA1_9ACTN|nr:hypothetical protein [Micromonospora rhizosphaerae]SCL16370.1 hypothetical protein GA0070624_1000 [Micromonospora rhizosphaerae]